ncbi:MAG: hypothetical protein IJV98_01605 [Clostridia bacterium]|nr:hypothetical protein [Clostridia bacterium]
MKLRLLVALVEKLLGIPDHGDQPRADMYLPAWILAFGIVLIVGALGFLIGFAFTLSVALIVISVICGVLGVVAILCWRNQTVRILSDSTFEYSTFLGKKTVYTFSEIKGLRRNSDSCTLFVGEGKVHIESCAIMTSRFLEKLDAALAAKGGSV